MKTFKTLLLFSIAFCAISCSKDAPVIVPTPQQAAVPNGGFETWTNMLPVNWNTNSCPACVPPYETYIVQQDSSAYQGQFAAKFIYNNVYAAWAKNGFVISAHPTQLSAFVKCNLIPTDSVLMCVKLYHNNVEVDNGEWYGTSSIANYTQVIIPISQNAVQADSASIYIEGGHRSGTSGNTEFWVDDVELQ
jgi:hypothetical protein